MCAPAESVVPHAGSGADRIECIVGGSQFTLEGMSTIFIAFSREETGFYIVIAAVFLPFLASVYGVVRGLPTRFSHESARVGACVTVFCRFAHHSSHIKYRLQC